jgi:hypothetical protein
MKRITKIVISGIAVLGVIAFLSNCAPSKSPTPGHLVIQLNDAFVTTREDTSWAEANTDTFTVYAYSADDTIVANATAADDSVSLDADAGSYKVVLLAGDKGTTSEVLLLAAGEKSDVQVTENETTTISINLKPVWVQVTALPVAETGRVFHASMHGSLPITALKISQVPGVRLGSGSTVSMSTTASGTDWSAVAQLTASSIVTTNTLYYTGGLLALQDSVIGSQNLDQGGYSWKLFTGDTSPYKSTYSQSIAFKTFATVCSAGCDYTSIQAAIDAPSGNDYIAVRPGTYNENLVIDKPLTLHGATWDLIKDNDYPVPASYAWDTSVESVIVPPDPAVDGNTVDIANTDNVTFRGFIIHSLETEAGSSGGNRHLLRLYALTTNISNIDVTNNIIGPNTKIGDEYNKGRMGLYLVPHYGDYGIKNSQISHNKIFGSGGNGNNIFVWGGYIGHQAADLSGTVIEYNDIYGSRRSGIELSGGVKNLTIEHNKIHDNGFSGDDAAGMEYKYGNGICFIRLGSETANADALWISDITIRYNKIYNNKQFGIYMGPKNKDHTIVGNDIYDNAWDAIQIDLKETYHQSSGALEESDKTSNISFTANNIYDNGFGASVIGAPTNGFMLDATNNWWGAASGPGPVGAGDDASANVNSGSYTSEPLN